MTEPETCKCKYDDKCRKEHLQILRDVEKSKEEALQQGDQLKLSYLCQPT